MSMTVNPKARDLTLKLDDSCNCRSACCGKPPQSPSEKQVYINSKGQVVAFDLSKGDEATAISRSISHLKDRINQVAQRTVADTEKVSHAIASVVDDSIRSQAALTLDQVNRINDIVERHLI